VNEKTIPFLSPQTILDIAYSCTGPVATLIMFFTFSHTSNNSHKGITDGQVLYSLKSLCNSFASCSHTVAAAERKRVGKGENKHL